MVLTLRLDRPAAERRRQDGEVEEMTPLPHRDSPSTSPSHARSAAQPVEQCKFLAV
jgi:hypothetical protein